MTNLFQHRLLNQPFGDPALYVRLAGEKKALLIDLGDVSCLEPGKLLKVEDVFVSHTHIDHFIGFDHYIVGKQQANYAIQSKPAGNYIIIGGDKSDKNADNERSGCIYQSYSFIRVSQRAIADLKSPDKATDA